MLSYNFPHLIINVGLLKEHLVLGPREPLEPGRGSQKDDEDAEKWDQEADPVDQNALGRLLGVLGLPIFPISVSEWKFSVSGTKVLFSRSWLK